MNLLDNKEHQRVFDALKRLLADSTSLDVLSGEFSIFAFDALVNHLHEKDVRILLSSEKGSIPTAKQLLGRFEERDLRNELTSSHVAKRCAEWFSKHARISTVQAPILHSLYIAKEQAIQGSSTFSVPGFGLVPSPRFEMNTLFEGKEEVQRLKEFFEGLWNDKRLTGTSGC